MSYNDFFYKIDNYIFNYYLYYLNDVTSMNNAFLTIPFFYFRNDFLSKVFKYNINKNDILDMYEFIKNNDSSYLFLIDKDGGFLKNPEFLTKNEIIDIEQILKENPNNFYALTAFITYHYNKGKLDIGIYFDRLLEIEKDNPYILAKLSRYQASVLYKKYKNKKYLLLGKNSLEKAINQFNRIKEIPTFFYSWLGYIENELGNFDIAIEYYDNVILLNNSFGVKVPEPYVWKIFSLNNQAKYNESLEIGLWFGLNDELNKNNDKRDFRFYKVMADNYFNLGNYELFKNYLYKAIKDYLDNSSFHFNYGLTLDFNNNKLKFEGILKNSYESFLLYNKNYIQNDFDYIILSIAFLYIQKLLGTNIEFKDTRGIELISYNYLQSIYEGKYK